jgi:hypothetical protein
VVITHGGVVNGVLGSPTSVGCAVRGLRLDSVNFDVSVFEIITTLAVGGIVELGRDVIELGERGAWSGAVVSSVPSVFAGLIDGSATS